MSNTNPGAFVWYELMTTDPKAAIAFYSEVVGWKTQPFEGADYTMWVASQGPLGGVVVLPEAAKAMGAPPNWMAHVQVTDVDATAARVTALGGRVFVAPQDVPKVGRFSVIADPQGATISIFKPSAAMEAHDSSKSGEFCWSELLTTDQAAGFAFYSELFGWKKLAEHDMGPMGKYLLFGEGDKQRGGIMNKPAEMKMPSAWLYYTQVDDLDAAIGRATKLGAKVLNGPITVPTGERIAQLLDPQGAAFALHGK